MIQLAFTPQFSVIIPFHNAKNTLPEALASLRQQTESDWEAILVDDASKDGSVTFVQAAAANDPRLRLLHDPMRNAPRGAAASRNLGIDAANGLYIALLDADDRWLPTKLGAQRRAFENGADIVFSSYRRITHDGAPLNIVPAAARVAWADALAGNPIGCLTGAWRRKRFPQARMPERGMHEDYAFWLTLLREGAVAQGLPEVLAEYRVHPGSASANKLRAAHAVWEILGTQELGVMQRSLGFIRYVQRALVRRL